MLPNNWLEYQEFADVDAEITKNVYNTYCTPKYCFVEKYFDSCDPKIHVPRHYFRVFMWPLSLRNAGPRSITHLQCFEIGYCGHPNLPNVHIQLNQDNKLITSNFQEEDHSFIHY